MAFRNIRGYFDIVIGNPPYISAPAQVANTQLAQQRTILTQGRQYKTLYQKWDLYIPFIERGLQLSETDGITSMIVPYPLTNQTYGKLLRDEIINNQCLIELVDLNGTKIFENATVSNCIPFIRKSIPQERVIISGITEGIISHNFAKFRQDIVQDENTAVWNLTAEKRQTNKHSKMHVLGDYCYISVGMVLNADENTAKGEFSKEDLITDTCDSIHSRKYIEAKDIERYLVKRTRYLEYNTSRCPGKLRRPTFRELYECKKLMFNRLGSLQVYFDDDIHFLHSDSMFSAVLWKDLKTVSNKSITASITRYSSMGRRDMEDLSEGVDLQYILGILNSKYAAVLLANLRGGDYHIYPEHLRNIPIPTVTHIQQQPIVSLVRKILSAKSTNSQADTKILEATIDRMVYDLYGISEEERRIIDPAYSD